MNPATFIKFAQIVEKLKGLKRAGWVKYKIKDPELEMAIQALEYEQKHKIN